MFFKKNQIQVNNKSIVTVLENNDLENRGKPVLCGDCLQKAGLKGKDWEKARDMNLAFKLSDDGTKAVCKNCGRELPVTKTYDEWKKENDEWESKVKKEQEENRHLVLTGHDWECGFKYYQLSANIEYDDWLKIKQYFKYYNKGWSRYSELEWYFGEPTGWLTQNPLEVEKILVDLGLIKPENTLKAIEEREQIEKEKEKKQRQEEMEIRRQKRAVVDALNERIKDAFNDNPSKKVLSDAEANEWFFKPTFGKGTVHVHVITPTKIMSIDNMGDFKYGVSIPYSKELEDMITEFWSIQDKIY